MAITGTAESLVNSGGLGGNQTNVQTAQLANGGYVVAWTTDIGNQKDVLFQRYDGQGHALGGPTLANTTTSGDQVLSDIVETADGRFTLAWTSGSTVTTRSFNSAGTATSAEVNSTTSDASATGVQLIATGASQYKLVATSTAAGTTAVDFAVFSTAGAPVTTMTTINSGVAGNVVIDQLIDGNVAGQQFALLSDGTIISTANSQSISTGTDVRDIIKLQDGTDVVIGDPNTSNNITLTAFSGTGSVLTAPNYQLGTPVTINPGIFGVGSSPNVYDKVALNIGDGRIFSMWVADTGTSASASDAIYADVYNTATGTVENSGQTFVVDAFGTLPSAAELQSYTLSAAVLADGRIEVTWSNTMALTGLDVFSRILDARIAPVTVNATAGADSFVGTGFVGDTVSYALSAAAVKVDLVDNSVNTGDAAGDIFTAFENVNGGAGNDELYGDNGTNVLQGNGGDDKLVGRDGNDTLAGGLGNDLLIGGVGDDSLSGGDGLDQLQGGLGNDKLDGGIGDDTASGGDGNDNILGGDGNDKLYGQAGDDQIDGGIGNDFIGGGAGNDLIYGGAGDDTINGGDGDDTIFGGDGNDVIVGGAGFNVIDGGTGINTVTYANVLATGASGFYVDLDGSADAVGTMDGFTADDDILVNIQNITGSSGADYLAGNSAVNVLRGGDGNDFLFGRGGNDRLVGGAGADTFIFVGNAIVGVTDGSDKIADFTVGSDKIEIVSDGFSGINAGNIAAQLTINATGTVAANGSAQFIFDNSAAGAGNLFFDADGNGAGAAVLIATLTFTTAGGLAIFSASDFVFV